MVWLDEALIFLAAAALVVPITKRLGFGSVLGYLAAGIVIGPAGLGAISDVEGVLHFAEIGVVFLLFVIGLELHPARLWVMRRIVFGLGTLQVLVTGAVLATAAWLLGLAGGAAVAVGFGLALSSTAFVLQMLAERKELARPHGRAAFGVLLLQDVAIVPLIALVPVLAGVEVAPVGGSAWLALARSAGVLAAFVVGGHYFLRPVLRLVAATDMQEIFTATALLLVIGSALLMESLGLSMGLGAFLAGVLVADSEYRHELEVDIQPFKGLLLGLFFMAVGMSTNVELLVAEPSEIVGLVVGLMTAKALVLLALAPRFGLRGRSGLTLALVLTQGGEFGFVLFNLAGGHGLLGDAMVERLNLVVTLSMAATPLLYMADRLLGPRFDAPQREFDRIAAEDNRVVIAGFGRFGQIIGRILNLSGIPFTALEINPDLIDFVKRYGNKVYYGDARRLDLLRSAGVGRARVLVLAVDDVEASMRIAETVVRHFPNVALYARARDRQHALKLRQAGARGIIRDTLLSSIALATDVLKGLGLDDAQAQRAAKLFAEHDAQLLDRQYVFRDDEEALIQSAKDSAAQLRTLFESDASSTKEYSVDENA